MTTQVSGTTGVSKVQDGVVVQADLAANVAGTGPAFRAYSAGAITSLIVSDVKINLDTIAFDTASCFDLVNDRFQPTVPGYYQLNGVVTAASGSYIITASIRKNGVMHTIGNTGVATRATVSDLVYLNGTTDYAELWGYSATTQNTSSGPASLFFSGFLARAA